MKTSFPLISIIVPVYNMEMYLSRCVDSLLAQTYPNIEIILVNDGSTDSSWEICQEYEKTQSSVRAFSKPNGGLSSARNFGLNSVRGEYVGFVDSDDWVADDMYEYMYDIMREYDSDAVQVKAKQCSYYNPDEILPPPNVKIHLFESRDKILDYYLTSTPKGTGGYAVWMCLFRKEIACKYRFREGKIYEDIDYKYKVLSECNKFVISNKICYFYFQAQGSISFGRLKYKDLQLYEAADELYRLTENEEYGNIKQYAIVKRARTPFSLLCRIAYCGIDPEIRDAELTKRLIKEHRQNYIMLLKAPIPLSRKILAASFAINFKVTCLLINLWKNFQ